MTQIKAFWMNCFPGRLEFKKNVQAVTRSLEPRNYAGFRFRWYPQLITYLPLAYTSRYKPWESLWSSSATTPLVDFHHRLTACPSYLETCAARRTLYKKSGRQSMNSVGQIFHFQLFFLITTQLLPLYSPLLLSQLHPR